jgi:hypothetical protein
MIIRVCSADVTPGKAREAEGFWRRIAIYDNKLPEIGERLLLRPIHGELSRIMLSVTLPSADTSQKHTDIQNSDPEWQALMDEWQAKQYTVPGSLERNWYAVVERFAGAR